MKAEEIFDSLKEDYKHIYSAKTQGEFLTKYMEMFHQEIIRMSGERTKKKVPLMKIITEVNKKSNKTMTKLQDYRGDKRRIFKKDLILRDYIEQVKEIKASK